MSSVNEEDTLPAAGPASGATPIKATNINTNLRLKLVKRIREQMSVGAGVIAGMPTADPPELTPVAKRRKKPKAHDRFAGRAVFKVDPGTYYECYMGKRKGERYDKYLKNCSCAEEIREYGRYYWDEPIIIQNEQTGAMLYLKYGSK